MKNPAVVGIDIGGTKTQLVYANLDGEIIEERVVATREWDPEAVSAAAEWILDKASEQRPEGVELRGLGVGAMGLDTDAICREYEEAMGALTSINVHACNDAGLLLPAAGLETGIAVISGTGSIGLARLADGSYLYAGGWGWALGDEGSASGLVREATIAVLKNADKAGPSDVLAETLMDAFGVKDLQKLTRAVNDDPMYTNWAPKVPAVFAAAEAGSVIAKAVIEQAGRDLAELVVILRDRGADASNVIAAGSVITNQQLLWNAFATAVAVDIPDAAARTLDVPPAYGGVQIALRGLKAL